MIRCNEADILEEKCRTLMHFLVIQEL